MTQPLESQVGKALIANHWTICTVESCTGGLIASRLTDIAGSSDYVIGGFVTYSNDAKQQFARVQDATLIAHGAVSEETAREMALGAKAQFGADIAVSVTGIAGPGGGTETKPVGLTYIGVAYDDNEVIVQRYVWTGNRIENKQASADAALKLVLDVCKRYPPN